MARGQDSSFFVAFLTSLVVSAGTTVLMHMLVIPRLPTSGTPATPVNNNIPVPPVVGLPLTQARAMLQETGFRMKLSGQQHDANQPAGNILKQMPPATTRIPKNSEVNIVVSLGPAAGSPAPTPNPTPSGKSDPSTPSAPSPMVGNSLRVPRVTQMNVAKAKQILQKLGLQPRVTHEYDEDVSPNWVMTQSPPPGKKIKRGGRVLLVVNKPEE